MELSLLLCFLLQIWGCDLLPRRFWGDPSVVVDEIKRAEVKAEAGCSACQHKGEHLGFEFYDCSIGMKRHGNSCRRWKQADGGDDG